MEIALPRLLAFACVLAVLASSPARAEQPMTRDEIIGLAQSAVGYSYWWGHGRWRDDGTDHGSCSGNCPSCTHGGSHGADCSGLAGKVWQVPNPSSIDTDGHPFSTYNFRFETTHWAPVDRADLKRGDAMVHHENGAGHIFIYESGDPWGSHWAYECKGCAYGCVHNLRTAGTNYIGLRRNQVDDRPALDAEFVGQGADVPADDQGKAQLKACAGAKVYYWFELRNTGSASWVDWGAAGKGTGQDVRLGVPTDTVDPMTGTARLSVSASTNPDVHPATWAPPGGDCNDQAFCQRTVFKLEGAAPSSPGVYKSEWQLVDELRAWFGPKVWLSFNVVDCAPPAGPDASVPMVPADASTAAPGPDAGSIAAPGLDAGNSTVVAGDAATPSGAGPDAGASPPAVHPKPDVGAVASGCSTTGPATPPWLALLALALVFTRRATGSRRS